MTVFVVINVISRAISTEQAVIQPFRCRYRGVFDEGDLSKTVFQASAIEKLLAFLLLLFLKKRTNWASCHFTSVNLLQANLTEDTVAISDEQLTEKTQSNPNIFHQAGNRWGTRCKAPFWPGPTRWCWLFLGRKRQTARGPEPPADRTPRLLWLCL